ISLNFYARVSPEISPLSLHDALPISGYHGSAHFDPILVVLSPLYLLYPRAEMILVLQCLWVGGGVVPAYLIAQDKLGSRQPQARSEEHTSELQSLTNLICRLLL